ncbi:double-stranded RNA-specific editase Adar-like isoform X2 [Lutzomyia longipalpis]|uniref:double-stranded RNA-specific editase Adar-like isoform X2 n=1 Tax=Lutzomyia longipalpis TaxID=7200 RepID=UPI002483FE5C|nr:double-stranded RNA-specific editase Adar-like isoform X2 [Lutzomyia longipalpis]
MNRGYSNYNPPQQAQRRQSQGSSYNQGYGQQAAASKPFLSGGFLDSNKSVQQTVQQAAGTPGRPNTRSAQRNQEQTSPPQQQQAPFVGNIIPIQTTPLLQEPPQPPVLQPVQPEPKADATFAEDDVKMETTGDEGESVDGEKAARRRAWGIMKKKITNKERRVRQNRRLRKMLTPKNAITALHELQGATALEFQVEGANSEFRAEVCINNTKYIGQGRSKVQAKNNAAEKALRDFVIAKMAAKARRVKEEKSIEAGEAEMMKDGEEREEGDDVPMLNLVSFALHKLFTEWEANGFPVPDFRSGQEGGAQPMVVDNGAEPVRTLPTPREELPANAASTHPTMLLSIMSPGVQFLDVGSEGRPPNVQHTVSVCLQGKNFVGTGRTKKVARKNAAMEACMSVYGVKFNPDIVESS